MEGAEQNFHDRPQPFKCMEKNNNNNHMRAKREKEATTWAVKKIMKGH